MARIEGSYNSNLSSGPDGAQVGTDLYVGHKTSSDRLKPIFRR